MTSNKKTLAEQVFLRIVPVILLIYFVLYTLFTLFSYRNSLKDWNSASANDSIKYASDEIALINRKAFLDAQLAMSTSDSIGLIVNLKDSLVQLQMKGVTLRQVKFSKAEMPRFFRGISTKAYATRFSKPFKISEIEGTIEKNPMIYRKVPKDTLEAAQSQLTIDTTKTEFVEWHLMLDSTLIISVVQSDPYDGLLNWDRIKYKMRRHFKTLATMNRKLFRLQKPSALPEITAYIPANEAKSFFRALPPNGQVVVRI